MKYKIETFGGIAMEDNAAYFQTEEEAREYGKECAKHGKVVFLLKQRNPVIAPDLYDMVGEITANGKKPPIEKPYEVTADIKANCTQTLYVIHVSPACKTRKNKAFSPPPSLSVPLPGQSGHTAPSHCAGTG